MPLGCIFSLWAAVLSLGWISGAFNIRQTSAPPVCHPFISHPGHSALSSPIIHPAAVLPATIHPFIPQTSVLHLLLLSPSLSCQPSSLRGPPTTPHLPILPFPSTNMEPAPPALPPSLLRGRARGRQQAGCHRQTREPGHRISLNSRLDQCQDHFTVRT